jgi:single-strand DNA-binding protein
MNKVILIGNLANDPEAFTTQSGISRSTFRLAVQRRFANAQGVREADFLTIVAWRATADFCNRYLCKGRKIAVEGSIQVRSYDAQDGSKRYITEIIADSVESLGSKSSEGGEGNKATGTDPTPPPAPQASPGASMNDFTEVDDDELPF